MGEACGADETEIYVTFEQNRKVDFASHLETINSAAFTGVGIRVTLGRKPGFYSTSQISNEDIREGIKKALKIAKASKTDPNWTYFPKTYKRVTTEGIYDSKIPNLSILDLTEHTEAIINMVHSTDHRTRVTRGSLSIGEKWMAVSNSHTNGISQRSTFASGFVSVGARDGQKKGQSSEGNITRTWDKLNVHALAQKASKRARDMMDACVIPGGQLPVIWRNKVFASILQIMFGRTLSADYIQENRSPWVGKSNVQIAGDHITLFDDGVKKGGIGSREFDDEGQPQQYTSLITRGILTHYLYDHYTAEKDHTVTSGNARRSYRSLPSPVAHNLTLGQGGASFQELLQETQKGLYIVDVIGDWLSNPVSGQVAATVTNGYLVQGGELGQPVKGITVSADFFTMIGRETTLIAKDTLNSGSTYSPSIKINDATIAG
jgi:predicted Zn-dependent protease